MQIIKGILTVILFPLKLVALALIYIYKFCISPLLPHCCIYRPSCSTYTLQAIQRFGLIKGVYLGVKRIGSCTPRHHGGVSRVPEDIKGDFKWLI